MRRVIKLLAQENPIVDLVTRVPTSYLHKYKLPVNSTVSPTPELMHIYEELTNTFQCDLRPAGSAFNVLRACQVTLILNVVCHSF
jgi:hypothetical protein